MVRIKVSFALAALAAVAAANAQTVRTAIVKAPVAAIALGPTSASVLVNVDPGGGKRTVYVGKSLIAVSTPFWQQHIRVR